LLDELIKGDKDVRKRYADFKRCFWKRNWKANRQTLGLAKYFWEIVRDALSRWEYSAKTMKYRIKQAV
jgi:hypothetical protein